MVKKMEKHRNIMNSNKSIINNNYNYSTNRNSLLNINPSNKKNKGNNNITQIVSNSDKKLKSKDDAKIKKIKKIMEYIEDEKNGLSYDLALEYDNRTYFQYYFSLIRTKHNLIFSFCHNNNYNSKVIQIDLFFIGFSTYYTVNALFYNDDTTHNTHVNNF